MRFDLMDFWFPVSPVTSRIWIFIFYSEWFNIIAQLTANLIACLTFICLFIILFIYWMFCFFLVSLQASAFNTIPGNRNVYLVSSPLMINSHQRIIIILLKTKKKMNIEPFEGLFEWLNESPMFSAPKCQCRCFSPIERRRKRNQFRCFKIY